MTEVIKARITALALAALVLIVGFWGIFNHSGSSSFGSIVTGSGKMVVLYDGKNDGSLSIAAKNWTPEDSHDMTVEVRNEGEIDFTASMTTGDYAADSMVHDFVTTITDVTGKVVYDGSYSNVEVRDIYVPVGDTVKFNVSVQWLPENAGAAAKTGGQFAWNVSASQKV